jgi:arylsulfatase A-like enzyme
MVVPNGGSNPRLLGVQVCPPAASGWSPMSTAGDGDRTVQDPDVVLVTIDCWRYDALQWMPRLRERLDEQAYRRAEAVCAAPATRGAFAAIFAGQYYPQVYEGFDGIRDGITSLPAAFADEGYATGGFVGSNPFLNAWRGEFDGFWNDWLDAPTAPGARERVEQGLSRVRNVLNFLRLRGRVTATDVATRARRWYREQSEPRFLWMHLMDPHVPFFPGGKRALSVGPLAVYRAHWRFNRDPDSLTEADRRTLRECYQLSVDYLDAQLDAVLDFLADDAVVVLLGDHGEEFDHGAFGHARLYDETVRVPLLTRGLPGIDDGDLLRQIDVGATVLSALGHLFPAGWTGRPHDGTIRDALMLNHSPRFGQTYTGLRTERFKLVRTADAETEEVVRTEVYDLVDDPSEQHDVADDPVAADLRDRLDAVLDTEGLTDGIRERPRENTTAVVEDRLRALGYT